MRVLRRAVLPEHLLGSVYQDHFTCVTYGLEVKAKGPAPPRWCAQAECYALPVPILPCIQGVRVLIHYVCMHSSRHCCTLLLHIQQLTAKHGGVAVHSTTAQRSVACTHAHHVLLYSCCCSCSSCVHSLAVWAKWSNAMHYTTCRS